MPHDQQSDEIAWIHKPANRYALLMFVWVISILATIVISEAKIQKLAVLALTSIPVLLLFIALEFFFPNKEILESLDEETINELNSTYRKERRKVQWFVVAIVALTALLSLGLSIIGGNKKRLVPNVQRAHQEEVRLLNAAELEEICKEILNSTTSCSNEYCERILADCKAHKARQ